MRKEQPDQSLADLEEHLFPPPPKPHMPRAELGVWLKTARPLRAILPTPLVVAHAERKGRRLWDKAAGERAHALRSMEAVVCGTPQEAELERHARQHMIESLAWDALFWQAWSVPRIDDESRERLLDACSGGRGVVLSACHLGPFFRMSKLLVSLGITPYVVTGEWFVEDPEPGYWGRRLARWRKGLPDVPLVRPRNSIRLLRAVLRAGKVVLVYFDLPGRHETDFLGKPVTLVDGTARMAVEADALVMPIRSVRDGHVLRMQTFEPLDPRDFAGPDELHQALARVHERLILEFPAASADPETYGWGDHATPTGWRRPPRTSERRESERPVSDRAA